MKKALGFLCVSLGLLAAVPASADVTRYATGNYTWSNAVITDAYGKVLRTVDYDGGHLYTKYTDTVGVYGGGDTASGRRTAKNRAISKALQCNMEFFLDGRYEEWGQKCAISGVTVNPDYIDYWFFEDFARNRWCPTARGVAAQHGISGPVYVSSGVGFFGDAAGTESDFSSSLGSISYVACY